MFPTEAPLERQFPTKVAPPPRLFERSPCGLEVASPLRADAVGVFAGVLVGGEADCVELRIDDQVVLKIPRDRIQLARQEASF